MKESIKKVTSNHRLRLYAVALFFGCILLALLWRMIDLTILDRSFLQGQGNARSLRVVDMPAFRGMILDREGVPVAVSTPVQSAWINPKQFHPEEQQLKHLAHYLGMTPKQLSTRLDALNKRGFVYLKRHLTPDIAQKITDLQIPGLNFQQEFKRYYPEADRMAQLLGFTNVDDNGIEGLELAYQDWLVGIPGKRRVLKDRMGRIIDDLGVVQEPRPGKDLILSIDSRIQFFAYHELQKTLDQYGARAGSVVVLDTQTGEVLAVANLPSYNPNARSRYTLNTYRNMAITDAFEPGSVMKPFSIASAFESGEFTPSTIIDTRPSWMIVHGHTIRDIHNYGVLDVRGVLEKSSNVGVSKMVLVSPPDQLIGLLMRCGVGVRTESGYPGESEGSIVKIKEANPFVQATLSFGYGLSVTTLQLAKMYSIFANQGKLYPVTLLHYPEKRVGEQVISKEISDQVLSLLESVVLEGTGATARVSGYRVAGKTGTARIAGKNGYEEKRYIGSFVGLAPVSNPRLVVAVVIHEPTKVGYYGGQVAAPLFSKVMEASLRILNVPSDEKTA